jgi:hypothetical protein
MNLTAVDTAEIDLLVSQIRAHPEYGEPAGVTRSYESLGLSVIPDPFGAEVTEHAIDALNAGRPYSIIRMGDGEVNLLSFGAYENTPQLDRYGVTHILRKQQDTFTPDESWMVKLREMMAMAVDQADILGVVGLWRAQGPISVSEVLDVLKEDLRGVSGYWRAIDLMLRRARAGAFTEKILASAHLYLGVTGRIGQILARAERAVLITNHSKVADILRKKHSDTELLHIPVGTSVTTPLPKEPLFLQRVESQLPTDMRGTCALIGAGPWSEFYCTWVKERGGVGIDIGSGFDLLAGTVSRPIHRILQYDRANPFALGAI